MLTEALGSPLALLELVCQTKLTTRPVQGKTDKEEKKNISNACASMYIWVRVAILPPRVWELLSSMVEKVTEAVGVEYERSKAKQGKRSLQDSFSESKFPITQRFYIELCTNLDPEKQEEFLRMILRTIDERAEKVVSKGVGGKVEEIIKSSLATLLKNKRMALVVKMLRNQYQIGRAHV